MSGGSSGGKKKSEDKKAEPAIPGTGPMMTQPAFMGDNQSLLAQQLAAGGYGSMPDIMQMLTQTFTPMQGHSLDAYDRRFRFGSRFR
jgi:hypothetical protein